jgi:hypothetical protein
LTYNFFLREQVDFIVYMAPLVVDLLFFNLVTAAVSFRAKLNLPLALSKALAELEIFTSSTFSVEEARGVHFPIYHSTIRY